MRELGSAPSATPEDGRRSEGLRRANLYGVSSAKRLPHVELLPEAKRDARVRKDLQLLADRVPVHFGDDPEHHHCSHVVEDELNDRKHREDLGLRPPLDRIQGLQDLFTTVPKDLRTKHASNQQQNESGADGSNGGSSVKKREWRVGYKNNPHGDSRGPLSGMFEPFDAVVATKEPQTLPLSVAIAYPVARQSPGRVACEMQPFDEEAARDAMERKTSVRHNQEASVLESEATPWCPASYSTIETKGKPQKLASKSKKKSSIDAVATQPHALRKVATYGQEKGAARARKAPLAIDDKCVQEKQSLLAKAAVSYARIREQLNRKKDPKLRYSLPIEDPSKKRAYRLGLEPVPSTHEAEAAIRRSSNNEPTSVGYGEHASLGEAPGSVIPAERLRFRPRSAAGNVPFRSSALSKSSSSSSFSVLEPAPSVGKVAGAKRRPHSASVCYLGSSTVYCVDAPNNLAASSYGLHQLQQSSLHDESEQQSGSDFGSVLDKERRKRRCNQDQTLAMLSKRGMFHNLPVPQIFARLRRESLKNLTRRLQYARFEKMSMEEYMSSCGMQTIVSDGPASMKKETSFRVDPVSQLQPTTSITVPTASSHPGATKDTAESSKISFTAAAADAAIAAATTSTSLLAMRRMLFATRQQFHIALEAFNMAPSDVNLLFSALDVGVEDRVALWEVLCAVEKLQDGHAQLRRSRVQIKARDLPKDLDLLRSSFRIPNVTHAPLEVDPADEENS